MLQGHTARLVRLVILVTPRMVEHVQVLSLSLFFVHCKVANFGQLTIFFYGNCILSEQLKTCGLCPSDIALPVQTEDAQNPALNEGLELAIKQYQEF